MEHLRRRIVTGSVGGLLVLVGGGVRGSGEKMTGFFLILLF